MKVLGIVAEYNPFHKGHLYHLRESKEITGAEYSLAVMSGDFVQRGEPALLDKWKRAKTAVENGVDLVLELPFVYACNNAEYFAKGAIELLERTGVVTDICFGSEADDITAMREVAQILNDEPIEFKETLKESLAKGFSYPKAREEAVMAVRKGDEVNDLLSGSNDILGIEYLRMLKNLDSEIIPHTIKRRGGRINDNTPVEGFAGATAIRNMLKNGDIQEAIKYLPASSSIVNDINEHMDLETLVFMEDFFSLIVAAVLSNKERNKDIFSATEGLENRMLKAALESSDIDELIKLTKSKRYTETRIKRLLIHTLIGLTGSDMASIEKNSNFASRILAFNEKGAELLKIIKKKKDPNTAIVTNLTRQRDEIRQSKLLFEYDILSSNIYSLVAHGKISEYSEYKNTPFYMKKT